MRIAPSQLVPYLERVRQALPDANEVVRPILDQCARAGINAASGKRLRVAVSTRLTKDEVHVQFSGPGAAYAQRVAQAQLDRQMGNAQAAARAAYEKALGG